MTTPAPDTRQPAIITEAQFAALLAAFERRGASVTVSDPRVSAVQAWIFGLVGTGVVGAALWGAQSLSELNLTVTSAVARQEQQGRVQDDHEQRIRALERRP
jgi:hypothetical protein